MATLAVQTEPEARISARLTRAQRTRLEVIAEATGQTLSAVVGTLIEKAQIRPVQTFTVDLGGPIDQ